MTASVSTKRFRLVWSSPSTKWVYSPLNITTISNNIFYPHSKYSDFKRGFSRKLFFHLFLFKNHAFSFQKRGTFTTLTQIESDLYLTVQPVVPVPVTWILFSLLLEVSIVPVTCILHSHLLVVAVVDVTCILPLAGTVAVVPVTCNLYSHLLL